MNMLKFTSKENKERRMKNNWKKSFTKENAN